MNRKLLMLAMFLLITSVILEINQTAWGAVDANAGPDQHNVGFGAMIQLNGTGSTGDVPLSYQWEQAVGPRVVLSDPTSPTPTFISPEFADVLSESARERFDVAGLEPNDVTLTFLLTVTNGLGETTTDEVAVELIEGHTTGLHNVGVGELVYFNGVTQGSYLWTAMGPFGESVALEEAGTRHPHFRPMLTGGYVIRENNSGAEIRVHAADFQGLRACMSCHMGQLAEDMVTPWSQTGHATFFLRGIDGMVSSHYSSSCIECHTVGYDPSPEAVNGGFDDVAALSGWMLPAVLQPGNFLALYNQDPTLAFLTNIQCENCHGPGSDHYGESTTIDVSFKESVCGRCHNEGTRHIKNEQFRFGPHSRLVEDTNRSSCTRCHTAQGFVQENIGGGPPVVPDDPEPQTCASCHDPHSVANPHQLRAYQSAVLPNGRVVEEAGAGAVCFRCHNSRRDATIPAAIKPRAPHGATQGDMLAGTNAMEVPGETYTNSFHAGPDFIGFYFSDEGSRENDKCVTCHMASAYRFSDQEGIYNRLGEHSFVIATEVDGQRIENLDACNLCHSLTSFDRRARGDFDGDGVVEGVQTEVTGLLNVVAGALVESLGGGQLIEHEHVSLEEHLEESHGEIHFLDGQGNEVEPTDAQYMAAYNYYFVLNDGSFGVHNTAYAVQVLQASYKLLTGHPVPNAEPHLRMAQDFQFRKK